MLTLGFDVGKTGCRIAVFENERRLAEAEQPSGKALVDPGGVEAVLHAMMTAGDQTAITTADAVCAGIAGFGRARHLASELAVGLARRFGTRAITLCSDITTSHAGALAGAPGVVVAAGTGSVALAVDNGNRSALCDGWGYLLGDEGSGYAIGRAGLASALREYDGRGGSALLRQRAEHRFGALDKLPSRIHEAASPSRTIAGFARDVALAANEGDEIAIRIWHEAGRALAATAAAAGQRLYGDQPFDVATAGGLFNAGPLLAKAFEPELRRLAPAAALREKRGDALDGARLLAAVPGLPHRPLTMRPMQSGVTAELT